MPDQDFMILEQLLATCEQLQQRQRGSPQRRSPSSSQRLRRDVSGFAERCQNGQLKGRARKRKSGELFRRIVALHPDVWSM